MKSRWFLVKTLMMRQVISYFCFDLREISSLFLLEKERLIDEEIKKLCLFHMCSKNLWHLFILLKLYKREGERALRFHHCVSTTLNNQGTVNRGIIILSIIKNVHSSSYCYIVQGCTDSAKQSWRMALFRYKYAMKGEKIKRHVRRANLTQVLNLITRKYFISSTLFDFMPW